MYKAVINDNYLCHYNKNHSKTNGQFTSGDGDGDGISNDHANQKKKKQSVGNRIANNWKSMSKGEKALAIGLSAIGTAGIIAGTIGLAKEIADVNRFKKLNDGTLKGFTSKGKTYVNTIELKVPKINMSMDRVNASVNAHREERHRIYEGLHRGTIKEGTIWSKGYTKAQADKWADTYGKAKKLY